MTTWTPGCCGLRRAKIVFSKTVSTGAAFQYGLGLAAVAPAWHEFQVLGSWHQRLSDSNILSLDVAGSMAATSRQTPIFLLPSLGGADTVRGFRQDAALGRKLWAVQTEFWAPVPTTVTPRDGDSVREFLRKNVRLAAFVDFGGIYDTSLPVFGGMAFPRLQLGCAPDLALDCVSCKGRSRSNSIGLTGWEAAPTAADTAGSTSA